MQCQCSIDASTMVDSHGLLEMRGETRWLGGQGLLVGYQNLQWMPVIQRSYEIAARNNWIWQHGTFKYFPRLRGSLSSMYSFLHVQEYIIENFFS